MATKIGAGFEVSAYEPVDSRILLTKEEMRNIIGDDDPDTTPGDHAMPEKYFALCTDDNCMYVFDYEATPNDETGKFVKMAGGSGEGGNTPSCSSGTASEMASALSSATKGDLFYNTDDKKLYVADGNPLAWVEKAPEKGQMIYDDTSKTIRVFDGESWKKLDSLIGANMYFDEEANSQIGHTIYIRDTVPDRTIGKAGDICLVRVE